MAPAGWLDGRIGSLNTAKMAALSGTSLVPVVGDSRKTTGGLVVGTTGVNVDFDPSSRVMTMVSVSPTSATIGSGSNPPFAMGPSARKLSAKLRRLEMSTRTAEGIVPGGSPTYAAWSPRPEAPNTEPPGTTAPERVPGQDEAEGVAAAGLPTVGAIGWSDEQAGSPSAMPSNRTRKRNAAANGTSSGGGDTAYNERHW
jgi:hypothetical protein